MSNHPPDGGWGWVVVFASFMTFALSTGSIYSFGVLYVAFLDAFGETKAKTAWVGSIQVCLFAVTTPIGIALARKIGHQKTVMLGGFLSFLGHITSSFANSLNIIYFTYSIFTGLGPGIVYVTSIEIVSIYFKRKLSIAIGLALAGTGAGQFVVSLFTQYLLDSYGWRGTLLILSAFVSNSCVAGALMWPLKVRNPDNTAIGHKANPGIGQKEDQNIADIEQFENPHGKTTTAQTILDNTALEQTTMPDAGEPKDDDMNVTPDNDNATSSHFVDVGRGDRQSDHTDAISCNRFKHCISFFLDLSLFHEPVYWILIFIAIGQAIANTTVVVHMVRRAQDYGISQQYSSLIPAVMGLSQVIARPSWGAVGHIPRLRAHIPFGISLAVCGISILFGNYVRTFVGQTLFIIFFGIGIGGWNVYNTIVVGSFLGPEKIGYGCSFLFQVIGVTSLLASPLAGWIRDITGVYNGAFWMAALAALVGCIMAFFLPVIDNMAKGKYNSDTPPTSREEIGPVGVTDKNK